MIFEVNAEQIQRLNQTQLVSLLRKLIQAELNKNSIPLSSGTAPAQINIPDGGEDGRVSWTGGVNQTDWLPNRFTIFQSKKGKTTPVGLKAETQTKSSANSDTPELNEALQEALTQSGAYVIVTETPVVGTNVDRRISAIREGITETGNDPAHLSSIRIYDCNKLASWTNTHPSVALWLNSLLQEVHLGGFQTYEQWGKTPEIADIPFQESTETRFTAKGIETLTWSKQDSTISDKKSFSGMKEVINTFFLSKGNSIRVVGPSGYGKTRFVHQLVDKETAFPQDFLDECQIIYCVHDDVSEKIINIVRQIASTGSRALLIVDDCPDEIHKRLYETVHIDGSRCLLLTIGFETKTQGMRKNLVVELGAASDELIDNIASSINDDISSRNTNLIRDLSQGFPRMAVFASRALEDGDEELSSVDALVSRIVWGEQEENQSAFDSLQLLSLFTIVRIENEKIGELEEIASYCGKTAPVMFRELSSFCKRGVIHRQGDYAEVQPLPLVMRLANSWIESNPSGALEELFRSLSDEMKLRMVGRLRWVSWSDKVTEFARNLLTETIPDETALDNEFGSKLLDRFVHLAPDTTMEHLDNLLAEKSIDELTTFSAGRRYVVWALEKLVFRRQTFIPAAKLLLRLGAAENESWGNNATGQFKGLFQLFLSGTEATPEDKLLVLDEGLAHTDERIRKICLESLERMLKSGNFSRTGGQEHIGTGGALEDWRPQIYSEVYDYYRFALSRLEQIALNGDDAFANVALVSIGSHLRGMLSIIPIFDDIRAMINRIHQKYPKWKKPLLAVNRWLYFDGQKFDEKHRSRLRSYYDELLPEDIIELLDFFSSGWRSDIHDPDVPYDREGDNDHEYAQNMISELVGSSPKSAEYFFPLLDIFISNQRNSARSTVLNIAKHINDPECLLAYLLSDTSDETEKSLLAILICNIISGVSQTDKNKGLECLELALGYQYLSKFSLDFIAAAGVDNNIMSRAIEYIRNDTVEPDRVSLIAYNNILQYIHPELIVSLISTLLSKESRGAWAAVDFLDRALHGFNLEGEQLIEILMLAVINPALFERERYSNVDWYQWNNIVKKLIDGGHLNDDYHVQLIDFIISVTEVPEFNVQLAFDDYAREILRLLIACAPKFVWEKYHEALEAAEGESAYRLESLFGADTGNPSSPGVLNNVPSDIYIPWMLESKDLRLSLILDWIQLFVQHDELREWSPDFISFIDNQVDWMDVLDTLCSRLTTGAWSGSYADKLVTECNLLLRLRDLSKNSHVHRWVDRTVERINSQISDWRRDDENRKASYRA